MHRRSQGVQVYPPGRGKKFFLGIFCWNEAKMGLNLVSAPLPPQRDKRGKNVVGGSTMKYTGVYDHVNL